MIFLTDHQPYSEPAVLLQGVKQGPLVSIFSPGVLFAMKADMWGAVLVKGSASACSSELLSLGKPCGCGIFQPLLVSSAWPVLFRVGVGSAIPGMLLPMGAATSLLSDTFFSRGCALTGPGHHCPREGHWTQLDLLRLGDSGF